MPNDNIMGIPTRACINGLTKEDTDRLKNALIKKIEDDETTVDITEDGKIILANENNLFLSFDGNILGITKDSSGDYIPWTVPYLPEDENENPLAPPNDTIMTSANIVVDPRIVHTIGNEKILGIKNIQKLTNRLVTIDRFQTFNFDNGSWVPIYRLPYVSRDMFKIRYVGYSNQLATSRYVDIEVLVLIGGLNSTMCTYTGAFGNVFSNIPIRVTISSDNIVTVWANTINYMTFHSEIVYEYRYGSIRDEIESFSVVNVGYPVPIVTEDIPYVLTPVLEGS